MASGNLFIMPTIRLESAENQVFEFASNVLGVEVNERNGLLVKVDYPIGSRLVMGKLLTGELADPDVSEFAQLLIDSRLFDDRFRDAITSENIPNLKFLAANKILDSFYSYQ
jgi:hypothetical protein